MRTAIEILVLGATSWPAIRFLSIGPIWRYYRSIAVPVAGLVTLYAAAIAAGAVLAPRLLSLAAPLALVALLTERWRARPGFGTARRLPPGSLTLFPRGPWVDFLFYAKAAARHGPVYKVSFLFKPMICVLGTELGGELLRGHADALQKPTVRLNRFIPRGFLRYMNPEDHRRYRKLFQSVLSSELFRKNEEEIAAIVRRSLAALAEECARAPERGIHPRAAIHRMLSAVHALLLFGVREEEEIYGQLLERLDVLDLRAASFLPGERDRRALREIEALLVRRAREYRAAFEAGEDPPESCLAALAARDPQSVEDETAIGNLVYMFVIGRVDLTGLFTWMLQLVAEHPPWSERLREAALPSLVMKEALRMRQSEYLNRRAIEDIDFRGFRIPKGWVIRVLVREGHRDPAVCPHPTRFDPERFLSAENELQLFGVDAHSCIGGGLTETVARIFLSELAHGFDWHATSLAPPRFLPPHWQPGLGFRIAVAPRQPRGTPSRSATSSA